MITIIAHCCFSWSAYSRFLAKLGISVAKLHLKRIQILPWHSPCHELPHDHPKGVNVCSLAEAVMHHHLQKRLVRLCCLKGAAGHLKGAAGHLTIFAHAGISTVQHFKHSSACRMMHSQEFCKLMRQCAFAVRAWLGFRL